MIALKMILIVMGLFTLAFADSIPKNVRLPMSLKEYSREYYEEDMKGYRDTIKSVKSIYSLDFIFTLLFYVKETILECIARFFILRYPKAFLVLTGACLMSVAIIIHYYF